MYDSIKKITKNQLKISCVISNPWNSSQDNPFMSVYYLKVIFAQSWGDKEAFRHPINPKISSQQPYESCFIKRMTLHWKQGLTTRLNNKAHHQSSFKNHVNKACKQCFELRCWDSLQMHLSIMWWMSRLLTI